jgi:hypothetical protein
MKKSEIKLIITISIALATILGVSYILISNQEFNLKNGLKALSFGISVCTFFWTFYFSFGWKIWGFRKIFYQPNLNGTWGGILKSDWKNEKGEGIDDIEFYIIIRQSFLRIHFTTFTSSFIGLSYSETFSLDKDIGLKNVAYLYRKETSYDEDEYLQEGATELRFIESTNKILEGKYWSNRKTNGKIMVSYISNKKIDSFSDAQNLLR